MIKGIAFGVWDGCHEGHLKLLERASKKCDYLIVAVSTDEYVKKTKNVETIFNFKHRARLMRSLRMVDKVILQSKKQTKIKSITIHKPDVVFVGSDWKGKGFEEKVQGVKVIYLSYTKKISSTMLRKKLK